MSVHLKIKDQINTFIQAEKNFRALDVQREILIEQLLQSAKKGEEISVTDVNDVTSKMNMISKKHGFPLRKIVSKDMVIDYLKQKEEINNS